MMKAKTNVFPAQKMCSSDFFCTEGTLCIDDLWIHEFVQGFKVSITIVVFVARADLVFSHILSCTRGWESVSQIVRLSLVVVGSCSLCFCTSVIWAPFSAMESTTFVFAVLPTSGNIYFPISRSLEVRRWRNQGNLLKLQKVMWM